LPFSHPGPARAYAPAVRLSEPGQLPIWAGANVCPTPLGDHAPGVVSVNCDFSQLRLAATCAACLFDWLAGDAGTFFCGGARTKSLWARPKAGQVKAESRPNPFGGRIRSVSDRHWLAACALRMDAGRIVRTVGNAWNGLQRASRAGLLGEAAAHVAHGRARLAFGGAGTLKAGWRLGLTALTDGHWHRYLTTPPGPRPRSERTKPRFGFRKQGQGFSWRCQGDQLRTKLVDLRQLGGYLKHRSLPGRSWIALGCS
jgi:hypothetical protein